MNTVTPSQVVFPALRNVDPAHVLVVSASGQLPADVVIAYFGRERCEAFVRGVVEANRHGR